MKYFYAKGKRKTAVAMVRLLEKGKGKVTVNDRDILEYFTVKTDRDALFSPLKLTKLLNTFDITISTIGGGIHAQAEAARHGISKALLEYQPELRITLKRAGFITRDSRMKERKKYGLKRARRAPQWQKR